jgi:hypothetical protein
MTEANLSTKTAEILASLRRHWESGSEKPDGRVFDEVYLDNARPPGMSAHKFAGHLSALEAAGLYLPVRDDIAAGTAGRPL